MDSIYGGSGNDIIVGGGNEDTIIGGYGADSIDAGGGNDTLKYLSVLDTGDVISGFEGAGVAGGDTIDFSAIDAIAGGGDDAFVFGGTTATANGVWYATSGGNSTVYVDTDGNVSSAELVITLNSVTNLVAGDFTL